MDEPQEIGTCEGCGFFEATRKTEGECRLNPPVVHFIPAQDLAGRTGIAPVSVFPLVTNEAWCGAFSKKLAPIVLQ